MGIKAHKEWGHKLFYMRVAYLKVISFQAVMCAEEVTNRQNTAFSEGSLS